MKIAFFLMSAALFNLSCKLNKPPKNSESKAIVTSAARKKGLFPLAVEQLGISAKDIQKLTDGSEISQEDMVLEQGLCI